MDDKIFDLMEKMYIEFSKRFDNMESDINGLKTDVGDIKLDVESLKTNITKINTTIEHELMSKITVLLDGYKQNSDKLDRIEKEVSKHEEIILRRVK